MKKTFLAGLMAMTMAASLLSACGGAVVEEAPPSEAAATTAGNTAEGGTDSAPSGSTFTYAIAGDTGNTLNPLTADDRYGLMTCKVIYSPLYYINLDGTVDYILAESMEANEDGTVWTLKLKPDLKWSDGEALTADDVIFTIDAQNENSALLYVNNEPVTMEKVDDLTVAFHLPTPSASIFELLSAEMWMLPQHYFEPKGTFDVNMLEESPVCSGPYVLEKYETGQYLQFQKNPNYVLGEASIDSVVYRVVQNEDTATLALQNGEVDAWMASTPQQLLPYENNDSFKIYHYSEGRVAYMAMNPTSEKMQDADYRKGILYALDKNEIMQAAYTDPSFYELTNTFLPPVNEYYDDTSVELYTKDLEKAKELTAGGPTDINIMYLASDTMQERMALTIQASLKEIGINVELNGVESAAWSAAYLDKENDTFDLFLGGYIMGIDPNLYAPLFSSEVDSSFRFSRPDSDELWIQADQAADSADRTALYAEIQKLIQDEAIFYPLGSNNRALVAAAKVGNVEEAGLVPIYSIKDLSKLTLN